MSQQPAKQPYAATHAHPMHIDIPSAEPARAPEDLPESLDGGLEAHGGSAAGATGAEGEAPLSPSTPSAAKPPPSRGILKNPLRRPSQLNEGEQWTPQTDADRVQWDEANIAATEIGKDSLMKIDEPKTPFVRYDAENDILLGDVPDFHLSSQPSTPHSPGGRSSASGDSDRPGLSSIHRRASASSSRSTSSSRSASFSLPTKDHPVRPGGGSISHSPNAQAGKELAASPGAAGAAGDVAGGDVPPPSGPAGETSGNALGSEPIALGATHANTAANAGSGVFDDSDEEMDDEARERHREFRGKMKKHYSNEAKVAMQEARKLLAQEEEDEEDEQEDNDAAMRDGARAGPNGANGGLGLKGNGGGMEQD